ncbi:MAG: TIGR04013 family B12-binding domain/radical SAM domain-containing protein [Planctomycetes bacterium]|nr:TIGR04013 family B12-binding domain/radical SAM domain-containing protein [Planctomycetota bacterium]
MSATLILSHRSPGKYALNVLAGALEAVEDEGGLELVVAKSPTSLLDATRRAVEAGRRACVAWSFYSPSLAECAAERAWLARAVPDGWTSLAGGVHASAEPEEVLREGFDFAASGEGEHLIRAVARALRDGAPLADVTGLARLERGVFVANGRGATVAHLDEFPAFSARRRLWGAVEITRGCIYACKFCQTPFLNKARFRHRSPENVALHAGLIRRAGMRDVRFVSPTSLSYGSMDERVDLAAVEALLRAVRAAIGAEGRMFFGTFPSEVRPEHATPEALALLKRFVDNDNLVIGGQSGSEGVLRASHRGHGVESIERAVEHSVAAGFVPNVDFLLGLPGEDDADVDATVALMERLMARGARVHGHTFLPLPGTPFRNAPAGRVSERTRGRLLALEGRGRLYGQWRRQEEIGMELVRRREGRSRG